MEPELLSDHETLVQGARPRSMRPRSERVLLLAATSAVVAAAVFLMSKARPHNTALRTSAEAQLKQEKRVCPTPGEKFDQPRKGCPIALSARNCLAGNKKYGSFQEAWAGCGAELECGFVMRVGTSTGYDYYLRRNSDPSFEMAGGESMLFSCSDQYANLVPTRAPNEVCHPAAESFDLAPKSCANHSTGCILNNKRFSNFADAWASCGESSECGAIMKWQLGYYLRRISDPDSSDWAGGRSMLYTCVGGADKQQNTAQNPVVWKVEDNVVMIGGGDKVVDRFGKIVGIELMEKTVRYHITFDDGLDPKADWFVEADFEMPSEGDGFAPGKRGGRITGGHGGLR